MIANRSINISMVDWQLTATTIFCEAVGHEVTLLVYRDWSTKCTGYAKYAGASASLKKRGRQSGQLECEGLGCSRAVQYKEKLLAEESRKASSPHGRGETNASPPGGGG